MAFDKEAMLEQLFYFRQQRLSWLERQGKAQADLNRAEGEIAYIEDSICRIEEHLSA